MNNRKEGRTDGRKGGKEKNVYSTLGLATNRAIFNPRGSAAATHPHKTGRQGLGIAEGLTFLSDFLP